MLSLKRPRQSFTFEFSNFLARFSFVFGFSTSAGNLLILFSPFGENRPVRVIRRAGKRPEITVIVKNLF